MDSKALLAAIENGTLDGNLPAGLDTAEIDALAAAAKADPGAPFEPAMVARLAETRRQFPADFQRLRDRLKTVKIRVSDLDKALDRQDATTGGKAGGAAGQGQKITFPQIDPWQERVDGAAMLSEIAEQIRQFVMLPAEAADAVALWIVHAFAFMLGRHSPRLVLTSPEKRCGKTTLLRVIQQMVPKPLSAANITAAAMFRTIEKYRPTLLIDEADTFLRDNEDLRGVINAGHERDGVVIRTVGEDFEPAAFSCYTPTLIAAIKNLPGTIEDRAVMIVLRRRHASEKVERFRGSSQALTDLARKAARFVADHKDELGEADPKIPEELNDRDCDNWRTMLALADIAGGEWPTRTRAAALFLTTQESVRDESSTGVRLLTDIQAIFAERQQAGSRDADRISSTDLVMVLCGVDDGPWSTWNRGRAISATTVKRMLKPYGVIPNTIKLANGKQPNGYKRSQFDDAFARYISVVTNSDDQSSPPSPTPTKLGVSADFQGSPEGACGEPAIPAQPLEKYGRGERGEPRNRKCSYEGLTGLELGALFDGGDDED